MRYGLTTALTDNKGTQGGGVAMIARAGAVCFALTLETSVAAQSVIEGDVRIVDPETFVVLNSEPSLADLAEAGDGTVEIGRPGTARVQIEEGDAINAGSVTISAAGAGARLDLVGPGGGVTASTPQLVVTGSDRSPFGYLILGESFSGLGQSGVLTASDGAFLSGPECRATDFTCSIIAGNGYGARGSISLEGEGTQAIFDSQTIIGVSYGAPVDATPLFAATGRLSVTNGAAYETTGLFVGAESRFSSPNTVPDAVRDRGVLLSDGEVFVNDATLSVARDDGALAVVGSGQLGRGTLSVEGGLFEIVSNGSSTLILGSSAAEASMVVRDGGQIVLDGDASTLVLNGSDTGNRIDVEGENSALLVRAGNGVGLLASSGTLAVSNGGLIDVSDEINFSAGAGRDATISVTDAGTMVAGQSITATLFGEGSATVLVSRGGRLVAPDVTIANGALLTGDLGLIEGDVTIDGGVLAPGSSPGRMTIDGDLTLTGGGILNIEIDGLADGAFDVLDVSGTADLSGGEIIFSIGDGFSLQAGDAISFLLADRVVGAQEATIRFDGVADDFSFDLMFGDSGLSLIALTDSAAVPLPPAAALFALPAVVFLSRRRRGDTSV